MRSRSLPGAIVHAEYAVESAMFIHMDPGGKNHGELLQGKFLDLQSERDSGTLFLTKTEESLDS